MVDTDAADNFDAFPPALADFHAAADRVGERGRRGLRFLRRQALPVDLDGELHAAHGGVDAPQPGRIPGAIGLMQDDAHATVGQPHLPAIARCGHGLARRRPGCLPRGGNLLGSPGPDGRRLSQPLKRPPCSGLQPLDVGRQRLPARLVERIPLGETIGKLPLRPVARIDDSSQPRQLRIGLQTQLLRQSGDLFPAQTASVESFLGIRLELGGRDRRTVKLDLVHVGVRGGAAGSRNAKADRGGFHRIERGQPTARLRIRDGCHGSKLAGL